MESVKTFLVEAQPILFTIGLSLFIATASLVITIFAIRSITKECMNEK
jgi:hypothetical protein